MASKSYPRPGYNGGSLTSVEHERLTHASTPDGIEGHPNDPDPVYADSNGTRLVKIRLNLRVWLRGSLWEAGPTDVALPSLAPNDSGLPRIDTVVLRLDRSTYEVTEYVLTGTPAADPTPPAISLNGGTTGFYDFPLANVRVEAGAVALGAGTVTTRAWYVASDGQIRCKSTTRPHHEVGRRVFEVDTGRALISTGTTWLVAAEDATGTVSAASGFIHSWAVVRRRNGMVTFALTVARPAAALNANTEYQVGTVQAGFRPVAQVASLGISPSNQSVFTYSVNTNGVVLINPGAQSIPANRACVLAAMTYPTP